MRVMSFSGVHIYAPNGAPMHFTHPDAIRSPFHIYCNDVHYQAVVPLVNVKVRTTAVESFAFRETNVLLKKDVLAVRD